MSLFRLLSNPELIYLNQYFILFLLVAFTKLITVNGQEYHLQLVDTAGQVSDLRISCGGSDGPAQQPSHTLGVSGCTPEYLRLVPQSVNVLSA